MLGKDAILAAAKTWMPKAEYIGKIIVPNVCATYALDGGECGKKTGDVHLHVETNDALIDIDKFGFNGKKKFPYPQYSARYQKINFDDSTDTLTIKGKDLDGTAYTVTLRKIE